MSGACGSRRLLHDVPAGEDGAAARFSYFGGKGRMRKEEKKTWAGWLSQVTRLASRYLVD